MALPWGTFAAMGKPAAALKISAAEDLRPVVRPVQQNGCARRGLLTFVLLSTATAAPNANDSKTALLQEYLRRSKENKGKNDKERLEDYNKRNYKDYFEFIEGSVQGKKEDELSEAEKAILKWLQKNR